MELLLQEKMKSLFDEVQIVDKHVPKCTWVMDPITTNEEDVDYLGAEDDLLDDKFSSKEILY